MTLCYFVYATTSHNTANNDTRSFDKAIIELTKNISCARSNVLLTMNLSFDSSQNGGVVCRDVIYRKECQEKNSHQHERASFR